jgi:hypothetical protein
MPGTGVDFVRSHLAMSTSGPAARPPVLVRGCVTGGETRQRYLRAGFTAGATEVTRNFEERSTRR